MDEVTAAQAAALTGLSERTIRRRIAAGVIPARKIGPNRYAIKRDDLSMAQSSQSLMLRIADLEQRVRLIEQRVAQAAPTERADPPSRAPEASASASAPAPASTPVDVREALAQLAYETSRLAQVIPTTLWRQMSAPQWEPIAPPNDAAADETTVAPGAEQARNAQPTRRRGRASGKGRAVAGR